MRTILCRTAHGEYEVPARDEYVGAALRRGEHYEEHDLRAVLDRLPRGGLAVDAGAHVGVWTVPLARAVGPEGQVLAFEPQASLCELLRRNVARNGLTNVRVERAALGHLEGHPVTLQRMIPSGASRGRMIDEESDAPLNYGAVPLGPGGEGAVMRRVDDLGVPRLDLLKVDVEGAEALVFSGARETIRRFRPLVVYEHIEDEVKGVTRGMRAQMPIPAEVAAFDVVAWCTAELGYRPPRRLSELNCLLEPGA